MLNNNSIRVYPAEGCKDKYYTYVLCKPCGTPFYVGKGKGDRINMHFAEYSLKKPTHKNNTIKKYGNSVIRSILTYHDSEEEAYNMEDWLLKHYGFYGEGGILTNVLKCREDIKNIPSRIRVHTDKSKSVIHSDKKLIRALYSFYKYKEEPIRISEDLNIDLKILKEILKGVKRKYLYEAFISKHGPQEDRRGTLTFKGSYYTESQIKAVYEYYFEESLNVHDISIKTGVPKHYLSYIVNGSKHKKLYKKYVLSGLIVNERKKYIPVVDSCKEYSDELIKEIYKVAEDYKLGPKTLSSIYNIDSMYISSLLRGRKRVGLYQEVYGEGYRIDSSRSTSLDFGHYLNCLVAAKIYNTQPFSLKDISEAFSIPKTTLRRFTKKHDHIDLTLNDIMFDIETITSESVTLLLDDSVKKLTHIEFIKSMLPDEVNYLYSKYLENAE
jgi:hypothetical protein